MEESISSSRTSAFHGANSYYYRHQPPAPPATATATTASDFEDADDDSGWTAYFLQLASDEEEDASSALREKQLRLRGVPCGRGSASTVSKPNKDKDDNKQQAVEKVLKKGVKKTKKVLHHIRTTRIVEEEEEEEEDPLQDTASSPLVQLNKYERRPAGSLEHSLQGASVSITSSRDRPPVETSSMAMAGLRHVGPSIYLTDRQ